MAESSDEFDGVAESYDESTDPPPAAMIDVLCRQAARRPIADTCRALEFAIGTGRVAEPLAGRGVDVVGIDSSAAMLSVLAAKALPNVEAVRGDMGSIDITESHGRFGVVYLVHSTLNSVTTQRGQVAVFANAARHLAPGGAFIVEVAVPALWQLEPGERSLLLDEGSDYFVQDDYINLAEQQFVSRHHWVDDEGAEQAASTLLRWVWPSELDLMAQLAGLVLDARWQDWDGTAFEDDSPFHVSVYRAPMR